MPYRKKAQDGVTNIMDVTSKTKQELIIMYRAGMKMMLKRMLDQAKVFKKTKSRTELKKYIQYAEEYQNFIGPAFGDKFRKPRLLLLSKSMKYKLAQWSKRIHSRDNNTCQTCGVKSKHAHHILRKALYPKLMYSDNNGIALCENCHIEAHKMGFKAKMY